MSRRVSKKTSGVSAPILVIRMDGREIGVSLVSSGGAVFEQTIGDHQELLRAIFTLTTARGMLMRPAAILVVGVAERFSDSRSVATVANTLAFAWDVPIAVTAKLPARQNEKSLQRFFTSKRSAVRIRYSGKPNITTPKKKKVQSSSRVHKKVVVRP
jgi:hypothetical protein